MKKIIWERWKDPLAPSVRTFTPGEDEDDPEFREAINSFEFDDGDDKDELMVDEDEKTLRVNARGPIVIGPMGIVPIHEGNLPSKIYNFWMGHTDFDIEDDVKEKLEYFPGIETLDIFTRYRFRIGIGKAFDEHEVLQGINKALCSSPAQEQPTKASPLEHIQTILDSKYPYWAILVREDGKHEFFGGNSQSEVLKLIENSEAKSTIVSWESGSK